MTARQTSQRGSILLSVVVAIALLAAITYMLSYQSVSETNITSGEIQRDRLRYVAEAGLAHARSQLALNTSCDNYADIPKTDFAGESYTASFSPTKGSPVKIKASVDVADGKMLSLTTAEVLAYQSRKTIVLQPGQSGQDTHILFDDPAGNYGDDNKLITDAEQGGKGPVRSLLRFDLSSVPSGAKVFQAELGLYQHVESGDGDTVEAHGLLRDWDESANWSTSNGKDSWTTPGGDYDPNVEGSFVAAGIGWKTLDLTYLAARWIEGRKPNYGIVLLSPPASGNREDIYYSSDDSQSTLRPKLTIRYGCECGKTCDSAPAGKNVLLVVGDTGNLTVEQADKKTLMEGWGHTVSLIATSASQTDFDNEAANNDVIYVPELGSAPMSELGDKADNLPKGVITEESRKALLMGSFNLFPFVDTKSINITDNTHFVTETLPIGNVDLSTSVQSFWVLEPTLATDLHVLGELNGTEPGLAYLDKDELRNDDTPAPARRVKLPWGAYNFDVNKLTADGLEIMRRAIEWGASEPTGSGPKNVLFVVGDVGGPGMTDEEIAHQTLIESWGHTVEIIEDGASQADFDAAVAGNDVVFMTNDITASTLGTKLVNATIGVVTSEDNLSDEFGMASAIGWDSGTLVEINDNTHYITSPFPTGLLTVLSTSESLAYVTGTLSTDLGQLASSSSGYGIVTLESGASMYGGGSAAGRRAQLPWGGNGFDPNNLTADGLTILQRAIEWGAGAPSASGPLPGYFDQFNSRTCDPADDYAGSDGTLDWSPQLWTEFNESDGPCAGRIQIESDSLVPDPTSYRLAVHTNSRRMQRTVDLSIMTVPMLTFDYRLDSYPADDFFRLRVSDDGGISWTELDRIEGPLHHTDYQSASYDLSAFIDTNTILSFEFNGISTSSTAYIDNVRIYDNAGGGGGGGDGGGGGGSCDGNFRDNFNAQTFTGSNGTLAWATDWIEVGESNGPTSGDIQVMEDLSQFVLRTRDNDNGGEGVEREADISGAATATLNYDYRRMNLDSSSDFTSVEVSANGAAGPWTELTRHDGSGNDSSYQPASHDITAYKSANTRIRFKTSSSMGSTDTVWFDNVEIVCTP